MRHGRAAAAARSASWRTGDSKGVTVDTNAEWLKEVEREVKEDVDFAVPNATVNVEFVPWRAGGNAVDKLGFATE